MINNFLIALTDNDKKLLFSLLLVLIILLVLIGYIGMLIYRVMKWQGKKMDTLCHDVVVTKVITNKKQLHSYGTKKNWALFFKQATIPILIILVAVTILLVYDAVQHDFTYNPFSMEKGFGSLFFTFELSENEYYTWWIFAIKAIKVTHYPTFIPEAWCGYVVVTLFIVGGIYYLIVVQNLISRTARLHKLNSMVFEKSLENYSQGNDLTAFINENKKNEEKNINKENK